jgi:Tol biopolymer transport system component
VPTRLKFTTDEGTWPLDLSPDGRTIVFDLLGDITIPATGGKATRLTRFAVDGQPRFAPDGKSIVFVEIEQGAKSLADRSPRYQPAAATRGANQVCLSRWTPDGVW